MRTTAADAVLLAGAAPARAAFRGPGGAGNVALLVAATLGVMLLSLAFPLLSLQIYDRIAPNPGTGTLGVLVVAVAVAVVLEAVLRLCRSAVTSLASARFEHRVANAAMARTLAADVDALHRLGAGRYLNAMSAVGRLKDVHGGAGLVVVVEMAFVPLFLGFIWFTTGPLVLVPLAVLVAFALSSLVLGARLRRALAHRTHVNDERLDFLIEALEGIHTLKAFGMETVFERRHEALQARSSAANHAVTLRSAALFGAGTLFSGTMMLAVVIVGAVLVHAGSLSGGGLIAAIILSGRTMLPTQRALGLWARHQDYRVARRAVDTLFALPGHAPPRDVAGGEGRAAASAPDGSLTVVGLSARRGGRLLFDGLDLSIAAGEAVHITGEDAADTSALLEMIAGVYSPAAGMIRLGGTAIGDLAPDERPRHVGLVRQEALVFRGTVRDNITAFGEIPEGQARQVATLLEVDRDVARLPAGFDTPLTGTAHDAITAGLRQRIAITRALAAKPRLILFDRADRALDRRGYATIYSLLARLKGRATLVLVSNDENIAGLADRTLRLEAGRLVAAGRPTGTNIVSPYRELRL